MEGPPKDTDVLFEEMFERFHQLAVTKPDLRVKTLDFGLYRENYRDLKSDVLEKRAINHQLYCQAAGLDVIDGLQLHLLMLQNLKWGVPILNKMEKFIFIFLGEQDGGTLRPIYFGTSDEAETKIISVSKTFFKDPKKTDRGAFTAYLNQVIDESTIVLTYNFAEVHSYFRDWVIPQPCQVFDLLACSQVSVYQKPTFETFYAKAMDLSKPSMLNMGATFLSFFQGFSYPWLEEILLNTGSINFLQDLVNFAPSPHLEVPKKFPKIPFEGGIWVRTDLKFCFLALKIFEHSTQNSRRGADHDELAALVLPEKLCPSDFKRHRMMVTYLETLSTKTAPAMKAYVTQLQHSSEVDAFQKALTNMCLMLWNRKPFDIAVTSLSGVTTKDHSLRCEMTADCVFLFKEKSTNEIRLRLGPTKQGQRPYEGSDAVCEIINQGKHINGLMEDNGTCKGIPLAWNFAYLYTMSEVYSAFRRYVCYDYSHTDFPLDWCANCN